ncbi:MAG: hypothetical protein PHG83_00675 [Patescibacteria group bacterium]|nr:hypothetical protein [Patescibacteria group bacterium]
MKVEQIREIQLTRLIACKVHKTLNITKEKLADLISLPCDREGALIVIPTDFISIESQMELIGGRSYIDETDRNRLRNVDKTFRWIYGIEIVKKILNGNFNQGHRGLTAGEGASLLIQKPNLLKTYRNIILLGSRWQVADVPCLKFDDNPEMSYISESNALGNKVLRGYSFASCENN